MGVSMSISVGNQMNQIAPEDDGFDFIKDKMAEQSAACNCTACLKKVFCFLCL